MKGAIAVLVKTPGLSPLKTRIAESEGKEAAERFHALSCAAVEAVIKQAVGKLSSVELTPYWALAERTADNHPMWKNFQKIHQGKGELGERLHSVYSSLRKKYDFALLLGADTPEISPEIVIKAADGFAQADSFVLGLADDGGYYLFGGMAPVEKKIWTSVPYSDVETANVFKKKLGQLGQVRFLPELFDIDTKDDLVRLKKNLKSKKDLLNEQKELLKWLEVSVSDN